MATKKKAAKNEGGDIRAAALNEAYEKALAGYTAALEQMRAGKYEEARAAFVELAKTPDEPVLTDRVQTYITYCDRQLSAAPSFPQESEGLYLHGVVLANAGRLDEAIDTLNAALSAEPNSPKILYARASAYALKRNAEAAVGDLRQAIAGDPQIRFQAVNDSDFEQIREEPAFIDIIEPTPTGA